MNLQWIIHGLLIVQKAGPPGIIMMKERVITRYYHEGESDHQVLSWWRREWSPGIIMKERVITRYYHDEGESDHQVLSWWRRDHQVLSWWRREWSPGIIMMKERSPGIIMMKERVITRYYHDEGEITRYYHDEGESDHQVLSCYSLSRFTSMFLCPQYNYDTCEWSAEIWLAPNYCSYRICPNRRALRKCGP